MRAGAVPIYVSCTKYIVWEGKMRDGAIRWQLSLGWLVLVALVALAVPMHGHAAMTNVAFFSQGLTTRPVNIVWAPDGNLWFRGVNSAVIGRVTPGGMIHEFTIYGLTQGANTNVTALLNSPTSPDGNLWFSTEGCDIGTITSQGIVTLIARLTICPTFGSDAITGITHGPDGNVWFTVGAGRIGRVTPAGTITEFTNGISSTSRPTSIVTGPDGNLWFTQYYADQIGRITPTGAVTHFAGGIPENAAPHSICVGPDGNLWFVEVYADHVGRITPAGEITRFPTNAPPRANPTSLAAGADGDLWFGQYGSGTIGSVTTTGEVRQVALPGRRFSYLGITRGPGDTIWLSETDAREIVRVGLARPAAQPMRRGEAVSPAPPTAVAVAPPPRPTANTPMSGSPRPIPPRR